MPDHPHLWYTCWVVDLFLFYDDSLIEPFLSHSVRLILFYIVVILWWSYLRRIDSHIIISMEYMLDLLYILIKLFLSHQDGSDVLVVILRHIFLGYLHNGMHQLLYWGIFLIFLLSRWLISHLAFIVFFAGPSLSRWAFKRAWLLSFDCLITYDSLVDRYVEVVTISPVDYFS